MGIKGLKGPRKGSQKSLNVREFSQAEKGGSDGVEDILVNTSKYPQRLALIFTT